MEIKFLLLQSEKVKVKEFLESFSLSYESDITETLFVEHNNKIIATISKTDYIIKCLAVDPFYQQENLAGKLITEMLNLLASQSKFYYQVFTKVEYLDYFEQMNFHLVAKSPKVAFLEGGNNDIVSEINRIKQKIIFEYGENFLKQDIASIVVNCNPVTNGHLQLIEEVAKRHQSVLVFLLEEDSSYYTYQERFSMLYLATRIYQNVLILPSSKYIISKQTFPNYFLKNIDEHTEEYALIDGIIFRDYFMQLLNIKVRYVGTEEDQLMKLYNQTLKKLLGERLEIIERYQKNNQIISASKVRKLLQDEQFEFVKEYVPDAVFNLLKLITKWKEQNGKPKS